MSTELKFRVKFKGKIYEDAHKDSFGHIWFNNNEYEWCPPFLGSGQPKVIIHGMKQVGPSSWVHTAKTSSAKLVVLDNI